MCEGPLPHILSLWDISNLLNFANMIDGSGTALFPFGISLTISEVEPLFMIFLVWLTSSNNVTYFRQFSIKFCTIN